MGVGTDEQEERTSSLTTGEKKQAPLRHHNVNPKGGSGLRSLSEGPGGTRRQLLDHLKIKLQAHRAKKVMIPLRPDYRESDPQKETKSMGVLTTTRIPRKKKNLPGVPATVGVDERHNLPRLSGRFDAEPSSTGVPLSSTSCGTFSSTHNALAVALPEKPSDPFTSAVAPQATRLPTVLTLLRGSRDVLYPVPPVCIPPAHLFVNPTNPLLSIGFAARETEWLRSLDNFPSASLPGTKTNDSLSAKTSRGEGLSEDEAVLLTVQDAEVYLQSSASDPTLRSRNIIVGQLDSMCSFEEMLDKQRTSTANDLERLPATLVSDTEARLVNRYLVAKSFQRSDANKVFKASTVRPLVWCRKTVHNLLALHLTADCCPLPWHVARAATAAGDPRGTGAPLSSESTDHPQDHQYRFLDVYNFLRDRLRSVWQDLTVQHCVKHRAFIESLEISIRFLIFSEELLCEEKDFNAVQNGDLLNTCVDKLMGGYADSRYYATIMGNTNSSDPLLSDTDRFAASPLLRVLVYSSPYEAEFWAYRIMTTLPHSIDNSNAFLDVQRKIPATLCSDTRVIHAFAAHKAFRDRNACRYFKLLRTAPYLSAIILHKYANLMRVAFLEILLGRVSRQRPTMPFTTFCRQFGFSGESLDNVEAFCQFYHIRLEPSAPSVPELKTKWSPTHANLAHVDSSLIDLQFKKLRCSRFRSAFLKRQWEELELTRQKLLDPDFPTTALLKPIPSQTASDTTTPLSLTIDISATHSSPLSSSAPQKLLQTRWPLELSSTVDSNHNRQERSSTLTSAPLAVALPDVPTPTKTQQAGEASFSRGSGVSSVCGTSDVSKLTGTSNFLDSSVVQLRYPFEGLVNQKSPPPSPPVSSESNLWDTQSPSAPRFGATSDVDVSDLGSQTSRKHSVTSDISRTQGALSSHEGRFSDSTFDHEEEEGDEDDADGENTEDRNADDIGAGYDGEETTPGSFQLQKKGSVAGSVTVTQGDLYESPSVALSGGAALAFVTADHHQRRGSMTKRKYPGSSSSLSYALEKCPPGISSVSLLPPLDPDDPEAPPVSDAIAPTVTQLATSTSHTVPYDNTHATPSLLSTTIRSVNVVRDEGRSPPLRIKRRLRHRNMSHVTLEPSSLSPPPSTITPSATKPEAMHSFTENESKPAFEGIALASCFSVDELKKWEPSLHVSASLLHIFFNTPALETQVTSSPSALSSPDSLRGHLSHTHDIFSASTVSALHWNFMMASAVTLTRPNYPSPTMIPFNTVASPAAILQQDKRQRLFQSDRCPIRQQNTISETPGTDHPTAEKKQDVGTSAQSSFYSPSAAHCENYVSRFTESVARALGHKAMDLSRFLSQQSSTRFQKHRSKKKLPSPPILGWAECWTVDTPFLVPPKSSVPSVPCISVTAHFRGPDKDAIVSPPTSSSTDGEPAKRDEQSYSDLVDANPFGALSIPTPGPLQQSNSYDADVSTCVTLQTFYPLSLAQPLLIVRKNKGDCGVVNQSSSSCNTSVTPAQLSLLLKTSKPFPRTTAVHRSRPCLIWILSGPVLLAEASSCSCKTLQDNATTCDEDERCVTLLSSSTWDAEIRALQQFLTTIYPLLPVNSSQSTSQPETKSATFSCSQPNEPSGSTPPPSSSVELPTSPVPVIVLFTSAEPLSLEDGTLLAHKVHTILEKSWKTTQGQRSFNTKRNAPRAENSQDNAVVQQSTDYRATSIVDSPAEFDPSFLQSTRPRLFPLFTSKKERPSMTHNRRSHKEQARERQLRLPFTPSKRCQLPHQSPNTSEPSTPICPAASAPDAEEPLSSVAFPEFFRCFCVGTTFPTSEQCQIRLHQSELADAFKQLRLYLLTQTTKRLKSLVESLSSSQPALETPPKALACLPSVSLPGMTYTWRLDSSATTIPLMIISSWKRLVEDFPSCRTPTVHSLLRLVPLAARRLVDSGFFHPCYWNAPSAPEASGPHQNCFSQHTRPSFFPYQNGTTATPAPSSFTARPSPHPLTKSATTKNDGNNFSLIPPPSTALYEQREAILDILQKLSKSLQAHTQTDILDNSEDMPLSHFQTVGDFMAFVRRAVREVIDKAWASIDDSSPYVEKSLRLPTVVVQGLQLTQSPISTLPWKGLPFPPQCYSGLWLSNGLTSTTHRPSGPLSPSNETPTPQHTTPSDMSSPHSETFHLERRLSTGYGTPPRNRRDSQVSQSLSTDPHRFSEATKNIRSTRLSLPSQLRPNYSLDSSPASLVPFATSGSPTAGLNLSRAPLFPTQLSQESPLPRSCPRHRASVTKRKGTGPSSFQFSAQTQSPSIVAPRPNALDHPLFQTSALLASKVHTATTETFTEDGVPKMFQPPFTTSRSSHLQDVQATPTLFPSTTSPSETTDQRIAALKTRLALSLEKLRQETVNQKQKGEPTMKRSDTLWAGDTF